MWELGMMEEFWGDGIAVVMGCDIANITDVAGVSDVENNTDVAGVMDVAGVVIVTSNQAYEQERML